MNLSPVARLKKTWSKVKTAKFDVLEVRVQPHPFSTPCPGYATHVPFLGIGACQLGCPAEVGLFFLVCVAVVWTILEVSSGEHL